MAGIVLLEGIFMPSYDTASSAELYWTLWLDI